MDSIPQVVRQGEELHLLLARNQVLQLEASALKAEVALLKSNQQVKPPLIRRKYTKRAPLPQLLQTGAVDAAHPRQHPTKRMKFSAGAAASVSCAAESAPEPPPAESAPQPPPDNAITRADLDVILTTLRILLAGMVEMSAARQGEVAKLRAVLQTHDGATEQAQPGASDFEVFFFLMLLFFHLF